MSRASEFRDAMRAFKAAQQPWRPDCFRSGTLVAKVDDDGKLAVCTYRCDDPLGLAAWIVEVFGE